MTGAMDGLEHQMQNLHIASGWGRPRQHDLEQYFVRQLRAATLQTPGLLEETPVGECLTAEDVMNKVEEYRQAEKIRFLRRTCMHLAATGLKDVEASHGIFLHPCSEVEVRVVPVKDMPVGECSPVGTARVTCMVEGRKQAKWPRAIGVQRRVHIRLPAAELKAGLDRESHYGTALGACTEVEPQLLEEMRECLTVEDVLNKVEEYRQAEKIGALRRVCMNLAAAGVKALEGYHEMALDACAQVEKLGAVSDILPQGETWIAGFQGLIYASKGDWKAAAFHLSAIIQRVKQTDVGSRFFHRFVVCLVAESLGYLMIHVIDPRVPADCPQSSNICCKDRHAFYPFLFFGRCGECHTVSDVESWVGCANLPAEPPEARCACVDAYHKAAKIFVESTSASRLRESLLQAGMQMPDAHKGTLSLKFTMLAGVRDSELVQTLALTRSATALWSAVMKGEESVKVWALCERLLKLAVGCCPRKPACPWDADSVDVVCFALLVMILQGKPAGDRPNGEDDGRRMQGMKEHVSRHLSSNHQPPRIYPWIFDIFAVLVHIFDRAGDYSAAAEVCVLHSMLGDVPFKIKTQLIAAVYWDEAGDSERSTAMRVRALAESESQQPHVSEWELRVRALLESAAVWDEDGQTERAVKATEEAWRFWSRSTSSRSNDFTDSQYYPTFVTTMRRLLGYYRAHKNRPAAYELVAFMDAHVDKLLEVVDGCQGPEEEEEIIEKRRQAWKAWRDWKVMTAFLSHDLGDFKKCGTILKGIKEALAGKDPVETGDGPWPPTPEVHLMVVTADILIQNGDLDRAVAKCEQAVKAIQKLSMQSGDVDSDMVKNLKEMEIRTRIRLCQSLAHLGQHVRWDAEVEALSQLDTTDVSEMPLILSLRFLQAKAAMRGGDTDALLTHIEEAQKLAANDRSSLVIVKLYEAYILEKQAYILREQALVLRKQAAESTEIEVQRQMERLAGSREQEEQQKLKRAAELAGEAAVLAAAEQRETCYQDNKPIAWALFFERQMRMLHFFQQYLWIFGLRDPDQGLIWAERASARFLLHQIHIKGEEEPFFNPEDLEKCNTLMESIIWATARSLGPKTAIIHYVYDTDEGRLYLYVVRQLVDPFNPKVNCSCTAIQLSTWLKDAGETRRTSLEALISEARTCILKKEDTKSSRPIKALVTLYALLVQSIEQFLEGCDTLVFAAGHGCLAQVPFAALYDGRKGKFLVQLQATRGVAVVPSITTLYRCLQRQVNWQEKFQACRMDVPSQGLDSVGSPQEFLQQQLHPQGSWQPSRVAFIAGNPEPMGLRWPQLAFSQKEATTVASFFNVQPCVRRNMTKKAVLDGLANSGVVLLATHGMVDEGRGYPHGCLLIQGPDDSREKGVHGAESGRGHMRSSHVFEETDAESRLRRVREAAQVLTASEIANLKGGIAAGLVVLSTCESGLGEVTGSEGLLGLGRALLQAGAATAVLTLWKVDDQEAMVPVVVLFHLLYSNPDTLGMNVCEALQCIMDGLIRAHSPIQFWASLSVVGSPLLTLRPCSCANEASSHVKTIYDREWSHCAQPSCAVCDRHITKLSKARGKEKVQES